MAEGERVSGGDTDPGVSRRSRGAVTQWRGGGDDGSKAGGTISHGGVAAWLFTGHFVSLPQGLEGVPQTQEHHGGPHRDPPRMERAVSHQVPPKLMSPQGRSHHLGHPLSAGGHLRVRAERCPGRDGAAALRGCPPTPVLCPPQKRTTWSHHPDPEHGHTTAGSHHDFIQYRVLHCSTVNKHLGEEGTW